MTYREWPYPGLRQAGISKENLDETSSLKPSFPGKRIPVCQPELVGIFKVTFRGLKNAGKSLLLDKAITEIRTKWFYDPLVRLYH
jgi:hypothetical protein